MITYHHGWGVLFAFRLTGSVFPRAIVWALPAGALAAMMNILKHRWGYEPTSNGGTVMVSFASFISTLGFMVVFRSNQAWSRYWQGAGMVQKFRGSWFNAASSLVAFCSKKPEDKDKVRAFQCTVVRLMSFLFGTALATLASTEFEVISQEGISREHAQFLESAAPEPYLVKCEVIMQWLQRTIVDNIGNGVLPIAPPILSRVFNDLSSGVADVAAARTINELPFPFHYAQMLSVMLVVYTAGVPCAAGYVMDTWWGAAGSTFFNVFVLWAVNYLAVEIERPFGNKLNDLPLKEEMSRMNDLLRMLLHENAQHPPTYLSTMNMHTSCRACGTDTLQAMLMRTSSCLNLHSLSDKATVPEPAPLPPAPRTVPSPLDFADELVLPMPPDAEAPPQPLHLAPADFIAGDGEVSFAEKVPLEVAASSLRQQQLQQPLQPVLGDGGGGGDLDDTLQTLRSLSKISSVSRVASGIADAPATPAWGGGAGEDLPGGGLVGRHPHAVEGAAFFDDDELLDEGEETRGMPTKKSPACETSGNNILLGTRVLQHQPPNPNAGRPQLRAGIPGARSRAMRRALGPETLV